MSEREHKWRLRSENRGGQYYICERCHTIHAPISPDTLSALQAAEKKYVAAVKLVEDAYKQTVADLEISLQAAEKGRAEADAHNAELLESLTVLGKAAERRVHELEKGLEDALDEIDRTREPGETWWRGDQRARLRSLLSPPPPAKPGVRDVWG